MNREKAIINKVLLMFRGGFKLFRNNTGMAWQGRPRKDIEYFINQSHNIRAKVLENPRPVKFGLIEGSSDLIGWEEIEVTPEMVGTKIARFTGVEIKSVNDRVSKEQNTFMSIVNKCGGKAIIAKQNKEGEIEIK